ncbi:GntR family transcriptional regulator [Streptomyces sp. NBC_01613]|uniref:hypothetical protein n=1 Tax=Streptomyces sp. NBC_01613 TaxID=2975896 RepID=UPI00386DC288
MPTKTIELLADEVVGLDPQQAGQASRVYQGLREAILTSYIPPGTTMHSTDLEARYKASGAIINAAMNGLAREGLTTKPSPSAHVLAPLTRQAGEGPAAHTEQIMRQRIANRVYPHDTLLPPYNALAKELDVPVSVLHKAIEPLFAERLVVHSYDPIGTRVRSPAGEKERVTRATPFTVFGETKTLRAWAKDDRCRVVYETLRARIVQSHWDIERALTTPLTRSPYA